MYAGAAGRPGAVCRTAAQEEMNVPEAMVVAGPAIVAMEVVVIAETVGVGRGAATRAAAEVGGAATHRLVVEFPRRLDAGRPNYQQRRIATEVEVAERPRQTEIRVHPAFRECP